MRRFRKLFRKLRESRVYIAFLALMRRIRKLFRVLRRTRVNIPFLALLLAGVTLVLLPGYFLHRYQKGRLSDAYFDQAMLAQKTGQVRREVDYLRRYLTLNPKDTAARLRLGLLQAQLAVQPKDRFNAFLTLQEVLRSDPTITADIRLQCIRIALHPTVNLFEEAKRELEPLLKAEPNNATYCQLMADCLIRARNFKDASTFLDQAIANDKTLITAYAQQAYLKRYEFNRFEEADLLITDLVKANPESAEAQVVAARYWRETGKLDTYKAAVLRAKELDPDNAEVVLVTAEFALGRADDAQIALKPEDRKAAISEAVTILTGLLEKLVPQLPGPDDPPAAPNSPEERKQLAASQAYQLLVGTLLQNGRQEEGEVWARKQVASFPNMALAQLDLADALISRNKLDEAEKILANLYRSGFPTPRLEFFQGRILTLQEKWPEACRKLESAIAGLSDTPALSRRANLLLALCYEQTGELDRRYEAFRRAMPTEPTDPTWVRTLSGIADTLVQLSRLNDAVVEYRRLATYVPEVRVQLARLVVSQTLRLPPEKRDWREVEQILQAAPAGPEVELVRAELASIRSTPAESRSILDQALTKTPDAVRLWSARIFLELADNQVQRANELYAQAVAKVGDTLDTRLIRLRLLMALPPKLATEELPTLADKLDSYPIQDQVRLVRALVQAAEQLNRRDLARQWLDQLLQKRPYDQTLQTIRFDFAILDGDEAKMQQILEQIYQSSGGPDTVPGRVSRAFYLVWKASQTKDPKILTEANGLLVGLERQRSGWSRLFLAQGRVADISGDLVAASKRYRAAVDLGESSPEVLRRLLELYYLTKQYAEAEQLMKQAPNLTPSALGAELLTELSLGAKNFTRAIEMAKKAVEENSKDTEKLLWLARVLVLSGQLEEAIPHLRRVTQLEPKRPEAWVALVQLLVALKRNPEAGAVVERFQQELDPRELPLVLAECQETLGQLEEAKKWYDEAIKQRAADPNVLRAAAGFKLRSGDTEGCRKLLEQLLTLQSKSKDDEQFARRLLALILASNADYATSLRSLEVLGLASVDAASQLVNNESLEDLRARVLVLSRLRGRKPRFAAMRLLETMEGRAPLQIEDQLLLAQLQELLGEWVQARNRYASALNTTQATPAQIAAYVVRLLRHQEYSDARRWIDKLVQLDPKAVATLALQARLEAAQKRPEEAVKFAKQLAKPEQIAPVLEECGLVKEAEPYYQQYATATATPAARLSLAAYYGRAGQFATAWTEMAKVWDQLPPENMVPFACQILLQTAKQAPADQVAQLAAKIQQAAATKPSLQVFVAIVKSLSGDHRGAIDLSREILSREPTNLVALNNLAFLVGTFDQQPDVGLGYLQQAMKIAGPLPSLQDTEAYLLMLKGDYEQAIQKLQDVVVDEPTAVAYFHLAQAYLKLNRRLDAMAALQEAKRLRLRLGDFHPLEQPTVQAITQQIEER